MSLNPQPRAWAWVPTLYFAEGLPYALVMTVSVVMYKRLGIGNADIAFFTAWLYLPWVVKPLWSPVVDMFGTRRRWVLAMQLLMAASLAATGLSLPLPGFFRLSLTAFWLMAFISATHDIAADGFYMLGLDSRGQAFYVGIRTLFYRLALIIGQGALVVTAGWLELSAGIRQAWMWCFTGLSALFVALYMWHWWTLPRPDADRPVHTSAANTLCRFADTFATFFRKPHIGVALCFMLLYRFPEAMLIKLISPFLLDSPDAGGLGLTTAGVGLVYGTVGAIGLMAGGVAGGIVASRGGLRRWMMPMAWSMSLTCLTFVGLAFSGADTQLAVVALCVTVEQLGYGFGGTAYTLYLIRFSQGTMATAHYAMSTGVMALGMMVPGMFAGALQELTGYAGFFVLTAAACAVTIAIARVAWRRLPEGQ